MTGRYSDYIKSSNLRRKSASTVNKHLETLYNFQSCVTEAFDPIDSSEKNVVDSDQEFENMIECGAETVTETNCRGETLMETESETMIEKECGAHFQEEPECRNEADGDNSQQPSLSASLVNWALEYGITLVALTALLSILRCHHPSLPKDAKTLLGTRRDYEIKQIAGVQVERQRCDKAIMKAHPPGASWESFAIRIRATKDTYDEARLLLPKALQTSDLQTEDEVDQRPAYLKRRKTTPKRWISDSESDEEQPEISKGKKKHPTALPTAPNISLPLSLSVPSSPMGETPTYRSHQPAFSPQMTARRQSVPHSLSAPSLMTSFQPSCEPILHEILTQLEIIKEQQKVILLQLQSQSRVAELPDVSGFDTTDLNHSLSCNLRV